MTRAALPVEWAQTVNNLALAYADRLRGERAENLERAIALYEQALELFQPGTFPDAHRRVQRSLARLHFERQAWPNVVTSAQAALAATDLLYRTAPAPEARQKQLAESQSLPALLAFALARANTNVPQRLEEAVLALERNRARWLAEALALGAERPPVVPLEIWKQFDAQRSQVRALEAEARLPDDTPDKRDFLTLSELLRLARQRLDESIDRIREYAPDFMPTPTFRQIQEAAAETPLVYLLVTPAGGLALIVRTAGEPQAVHLPGLTDTDLNDLLVQQDGDRPTGYLPAQLGDASMDAALREVLPVLGERLMRPLAEALRALTPYPSLTGRERGEGQGEGVRAVTLIPTGRLALLPLHAAPIEDGRCFMDEWVCTYVPSARALAHARTRLESLSCDPAQRAWLGVGDPPHTGAQPLPFALAEVQDIAPYWAAPRLLYAAQATRPAVLEAAAGAGVLHFSCHGTFDLQTPLDSALLLAGDDRLTLRDVLESRAFGDARLAVLSACQTAITDFNDLPEEAVGLPAGFLQAGVPGVVGSLWPVSDISTALLMERFYHGWLKEGQSPAAALQSAQRWLREVTNAELSELFHARRETAPDRPRGASRMPYEQAVEQFTRHALDNPNDRPFAEPRFWAAFTFHGV